MVKRLLRSSGSDFCRALCRSFSSAGVCAGGARIRASTRYVLFSPSSLTSTTCPGLFAGRPICGWSWNHVRGVTKTKIRMRMTAASYCHVPRSYAQKNVFDRICPKLAISVRRNSVDNHAVAHVHHAVKIRGCFGIVRNHDDCLAQVFVELPQHLQYDLGVF